MRNETSLRGSNRNVAHILITSGPTRQYLDPVRYLTNASSGLMGSCLAAAALQRGHEVSVVSGPVEVDYPRAARVVRVVSTEEMLEAAQALFPTCDGLIGAAAPCDYRPRIVAPGKINKPGEPLVLQLIETPDVVAAGCRKATSMGGRVCARDRGPAVSRIDQAGKKELRSDGAQRPPGHARADERGRNSRSSRRGG